MIRERAFRQSLVLDARLIVPDSPPWYGEACFEIPNHVAIWLNLKISLLTNEGLEDLPSATNLSSPH
jgi:hypothetical protein